MGKLRPDEILKRVKKEGSESVWKARARAWKYHPKTSKHMVRFSKKKKHISVIEERINVPLRLLKRTCIS